MLKKFNTALLIGSLLTAVPAFAQNMHEGTGHLMLSVGYYDALDDQEGLDFRAEYRPRNTILIDNLRPLIGVEATSKGTLWGGVGVLYDIPLDENQRWHLEPSLAGGFYSQGNSDIDLDYPVQFRTQLEISYEFRDTSRLGAAISHMSNAGLGDSNPGTEVIGVQYSLPIGKLID